MPVVVTSLVESTRNRLRYLLTDTAASPPIVDAVTLTNQGLVTPDLRTDILAAMGADVDGVSGSTLQSIIRASIDGFPPIGGQSGIRIVAVGVAVTLAQGRALLNSEDPGGILANHLVARATVDIHPRAGTAQWQADVAIDGVSNEATVVVSVLGAVNLGVSTAILDIFIRDTPDL